ncbi:MAG TPA: hypothetical protein VFK33_06830 [Bacillales bacterium]|nr:hypothetical protein [Bacillales bacterium]
MKRMKNVAMVLFATVIWMGMFAPFASVGKAKDTSGFITKQEFLQHVKRSHQYKRFKHEFLENQSPKVKVLKDENGKLIGYITKYAIKYNETKSSHLNPVAINFNSLLVFGYDVDKGQYRSGIIDYSQLAKEKAIYYRDLKSNKSRRIDVSDNKQLNSYVKAAKTRAHKKLEHFQKSKIRYLHVKPLGGYTAGRCWTCTKYEYHGGYPSYSCHIIIGLPCSTVGVVWGRLACFLGDVIGCYIPEYKICVAGYWHQCRLR